MFPVNIVYHDRGHRMTDLSKTKKELIEEISVLKEKIQQLEHSASEHKQAREAYKEREERYRALFDHSIDCVYIIDFEGNFIDANPAALALLGYDRTDIGSLNIASLLDERDLDKGMQDINEIVQIGFQKEVSELRLWTRDGRCIHVESQASVIYHDEKPHLLQGIVRDISERKRAEEALRESEIKYRSILENIEEGYYEVDLAGNFNFFNDSLCRIWGYPKE